jgi:hypothetical protein
MFKYENENFATEALTDAQLELVSAAGSDGASFGGAVGGAMGSVVGGIVAGPVGAAFSGGYGATKGADVGTHLHRLHPTVLLAIGDSTASIT